MKKSFSFPIIFMVIITAFFTFILAFLNHSTAGKIDFNQETELRKKVLYVFDIDIPSDEPEDIKRVFDENIGEEKMGDEIIYTVEDNGTVLGYAFPVRGSALWGSVVGYAGISADYSTMIGLDFVSHSETPGLGGRISEDFYKEQFRGLDLTLANDGEYIIYRPAPGGNVDAIAGATLTSKSVSNILNEDIYKFIKERGNN